MLFVKGLVILATLALMFGITALAAVVLREWSDDESLPQATPVVVAIFGILPAIIYAIVVLTNLNVFDIPLLSNVSLASIAICLLAIGLALVRSKLHLWYTKLWHNLIRPR